MEGEETVIQTAFHNITIKNNERNVMRGPTGAMTTTMAFVDAALGISSSIDMDQALRETMDEFRQFQPRAHALRVAEVRRSGGVRPWALRCNVTLGNGRPVSLRSLTPESGATGSGNIDDQPHEADWEDLTLVEGGLSAEEYDADDRTDPSQLPVRRACSALVDAYDDAIAAASEWRLAHVDHVSTFVVEYGIPDIRASTGTGGTPLSAYLCRSAMGTANAMLRPGARSAPGVALPSLCVGQCALEAGDDAGLRDSPLCQRLWHTLDRMQIESKFEDRYVPGRFSASGRSTAHQAAPKPNVEHKEL